MTTTPDTPPIDEFADAFASLQAAEHPAAKVETSVPAPAAPATPVAETPAPVDPAAPVVPVDPAVPVDPDALVEAVKPAPAATEPPDLAAQLAAARAELAEARKAPVAPVEVAKPAPVVETPAPAPIYTADEQATLTKYQEDWPDVVKGEALTRRAEYQGLINHVFESLRPTIEALQESAQKNSSRTQYSDLVALVPDYQQVREPTLAWIETQPGFLKKAYQDVAANGSAQDVAHLIDRFKKETDYVPASGVGTTGAPVVPAVEPAAAAARTVPPVRAALPAAAAAAATSLKVVKSSRSEPTTVPDPNDFDAAFAEFSAKTN
jgi:hypothetical protein